MPASEGQPGPDLKFFSDDPTDDPLSGENHDQANSPGNSACGSGTGGVTRGAWQRPRLRRLKLLKLERKVDAGSGARRIRRSVISI